MTDLLVQRDRFRNEAERLRSQHAEEVAQLRKELRDAQSSLSDMSNSKGAEVAGLVSRFNNEKLDFEKSLQVFKTIFIFRVNQRRLKPFGDNWIKPRKMHNVQSWYNVFLLMIGPC